MRWLYSDEWVTLEPGDTLVIAAGVPHNGNSVDADMIVVHDAGTRHVQKES